MTVDHFGALYIDGQPICCLPRPGPPRHSLSFERLRCPAARTTSSSIYHVSTNVDAWSIHSSAGKRRARRRVQVIGRQAFGTCFGGQPGPLQLRDAIRSMPISLRRSCGVGSRLASTTPIRCTSSVPRSRRIKNGLSMGFWRRPSRPAATMESIMCISPPGVYPVDVDDQDRRLTFSAEIAKARWSGPTTSIKSIRPSSTLPPL